MNLNLQLQCKKDEDRDLLRMSIQKWENILDGQGRDCGRHNCALCNVYGGLNFCGGCPVYEATAGFSDCDGSPYKEWRVHHEEKHNNEFPFTIQCERCKELAFEELEFLNILLEELEIDV